MQTRNLEVVVPKRREGSSPFERTIFSRVFSVPHILALACTALIRTNLAKTVSGC